MIRIAWTWTWKNNSNARSAVSIQNVVSIHDSNLESYPRMIFRRPKTWTTILWIMVMIMLIQKYFTTTPPWQQYVTDPFDGRLSTFELHGFETYFEPHTILHILILLYVKTRQEQVSFWWYSSQFIYGCIVPLIYPNPAFRASSTELIPSSNQIFGKQSHFDQLRKHTSEGKRVF